MRQSSLMKKWALLFVLCTFLLFLLSSYSVGILNDGIIQINTYRPYSIHDNEPNELSFVIAKGHRIKIIQPFVPDSWKVYNVPRGCFESYISEDGREVLNKLVYKALFDENNRPCEISTEISTIFEQVSLLKHDLMTVRFFDVSGEMFVYTELNVNIITPCNLYYYNRSINQLVELISFENRAIQGIHIMSEDRLHHVRYHETMYYTIWLFLIVCELVITVIICKKILGKYRHRQSPGKNPKS